MDEKISMYFSLCKEHSLIQKQQSEKKKVIKQLENDIKDYMRDKQLESLQLENGSIQICDKKINQAFKLQTIKDKLVEKLKCKEDEISDLAESLVSNKVFKTEKTLKIKYSS
jgi:hypothetical protein